MKYIICILISFTFSTLCLSQNELKVDVSYLKEKQVMLLLRGLMVVLARMSLMVVLFTLGKARKVLFLMTRCF